MPFYDLRCVECKVELIDVFARIADLEQEKCPSCGGDTKVLLHPPHLDIFKSQIFEHIDNEPQYVTSKKQLRTICDKNDLTCYYSADGERGPSVKEV